MTIKITGTNSVTAPGITGDDTDTGLVYGTNQVDISTGGTSRVTVDSSGKVGIGTTSPSGLLHVHQADSGTVDALIVTNTSTSNNGLSIGVNSSEEAFLWNGSNTSMNFATNNTERMRIDSNGYVTTPQNPFFLAKGTTSWQEIAYGSSNYQNLPASVAVANVGTHYNTSTYRFTAPVAGRYMFQSQVYWKGDSNGIYWSNYFTVNGSTAQERHQIWSYGDAQYQDQTSDASIILELSANDYVSYLIRVEQVNADIYGGHCYFSGFLIG